MTITASVRRLGDGLTNEVDVNGRHAITTDEPVSLGGADRGPAPHELLPAALASCIATTVATYARNRGWDIKELVVDVDYDTETRPRHFEVAVQLPDGLSPEQVLRLERAAASCPVRRALEGGFSVTERVLSTPRAA